MEKILLQIANTLMANLANTTTPGLFNGKTGIALFFYRYARLSGKSAYEDTASELLDEVFNALNPALSPSMADGIGSIGYGMETLLKERFIACDPEENILEHVDKAMLDNVHNTWLKERNSPVPLFSSGLYLLSRMDYDRNSIKSEWITDIIYEAQSIIKSILGEILKGKVRLPTLNSVLFTVLSLADYFPDREAWKSLVRSILSLSVHAMNQQNFTAFDLSLLRHMLALCPPALTKETEWTENLVEKNSNCTKDGDCEYWYEYAWWNILYGTPIRMSVPHPLLEDYIRKKLQSIYFEEENASSKLAALGLQLMKINSNEQ